MTDIWLIRHGETDWNRARRLQGWRDIPLNDTGTRQANDLATHLQRQAEAGALPRFAQAYSSDLQRTQQTAAPVTQALALETALESGLRERNYGVLEGLEIDSMATAQPRATEIWRNREVDSLLQDGESLAQFRERIVTTLDSLAARHVGESLLVFTHGGVLDIVWRHAQNLDLQAARDTPLLNVSINRIHARHGAWKITHWGDVSHVNHSRDDASLA